MCDTGKVRYCAFIIANATKVKYGGRDFVTWRHNKNSLPFSAHLEMVTMTMNDAGDAYYFHDYSDSNDDRDDDGDRKSDGDGNIDSDSKGNK